MLAQVVVEQLDEFLERLLDNVAEIAIDLHQLQLAGHRLDGEVFAGLAVFRLARDVVFVDGALGGDLLVLLARPAIVEHRLGEPRVGILLQHAGEEGERRIGRRRRRLRPVGLKRLDQRRRVMHRIARLRHQHRQRRKAREALQLALGFLRARDPVESKRLVGEVRPHLGRIGRGLGAEQAIGHPCLRKARGNYAGCVAETTAVLRLQTRDFP